uniref:Tail tape measure n=1 Tax=Actinobacteria phage HS02 TaxID=3056388 RepID=A0AA50A6L1_9VIRU|nr:MAG: tail tape measure [Actinobacteria phage HS02]
MSDAVWVPVNAEMKGFIGTLVKEASGAAKKGGEIVEKEFAASGKRAGESMASGLQASAAKVSQVSTKLATARKAEAQAAADVGTAEAKLENLRNSGNAKASQLAKAEQQLETAKNKQADAAVRVSREEKNLDAARSGGQTKSTALARAEDQLANARTSQQTASAKIRTAEIQLDEARANAKSKSDAVSAAEKNLMDTRDRYGANTKQTAAAERQLESAKKQAATANNQVATAEGRVKRTRAESQSAADTLKAKELSLKAVQEDLARSSQRAAEKTRTMGDSFKSAAGKAADFAGKYKVHATAALGGIGLIAKESISYAAEAEQSYGAVESIFGDHAQGIISASKGAAEAVGLSGREYRELTASTGAMLKNMGMPMDEVASKSQNLVGVASDLAATFGGSTKDAIEAVNALMRGEADPIERYGVSIKQSDINARMAAKGLDKLTGSAAKQAEAQTLLEMLTEQTSSAQGQFGRETDTAAHKQQVATAKLNDAKEAIGTGLLPMFAELASKGAVLAGVIGRHPKVFIALGTAVGIAAAAIVAMATVAPIFTAISGAAAAAEMSMWGYVAAQAAAIAPILAVVAAVAAVGVALWAFFTKTEIGRNMWEAFTHALAAGWDWVVEKFKAGLDWIQSTFGPVFSQIGDMISGAWDATVEKVTGAVDRVKQIFSGALDFLKTGDTTDYAAALGISEDSPIFTALTFFRDRIVDLKNIAVASWDFMKAKWSEFTTGFGQFYQTWIAPVVDLMMMGFQFLGSVVTAAFNGIWTAIQFVGQILSAVWSGVIQPTLSLFMTVVSSVASFVAPIFTAVIGGAFRTMGVVISSIWNGVIRPAWDFFRNAAGLLADVLTGNFGNIRNRFSSMGQAISNVVHGVINSAMNFFRSIFENAKQVAASFGQAIGRMVGTVRGKIGEMMGVLGQIPGKVQGVFASAGSWLVNAGKNIISGLINGIKSMFGQVENAIGSVLPDKVRGLVGFSNGGVYMAQGGITRAYIDGGIDKLERYANGGSKEQHKAQIAKGGEWRVWAEPETGGESYIPLAKSKRKRSTQILAKTADIFGLSVVDKKGEPVKPGTSSQVAPARAQYFANGGITVKSLRDFVEGRPANGHQASRSLEGAPYVWGGSNWGDCSGSMSAVAAFAAGINPFPRKFATGNEAAWLSSHGFHRGRGKQGDLRIGFKNGGPAGGHTAGTLPDGTNVEMGGGRGNGQIGGRAAGAWDSYFNEFFYRTIKPPKPPKMNKILDQNAIPDGSTMTIDGVPVYVSADDTTTAGSIGENTVTVALSPEDAAKATAAKGLGDQSIMDFAVDGIFDMLGMKDSTIKKLLTTKGKDLLPSGESIVTTKEVKEQPRTSVAAKNAQAIESDAVSTLPEAKMAKDPQLAPPKPKKQTPKWGEPFFAHEISRSAKDHKLDVNGAKIGMAVALVESGSPLKMWANRAVPESLKFRHDAVGSDYDSVGLFQQRDNGAWGTVKQRMTPYDSAGMFFDAMLRKYPNWRGMEPGAVAQGVQVSAFPDRYAGQMGRGLQLAKRSGVFDQGGLGYGKGLLPKDVVAPERVLSPQQTRAFDDLVYKEMPKQRDSGAGTTVVINLDGQEVLRQRVDKVEGELNINTEELGRLRRRTSVAVAGTTRGGAM